MIVIVIVVIIILIVMIVTEAAAHSSGSSSGWAILPKQAQKGGWKKGDDSFHSFEMLAFSNFEFTR